MIHSSQTVSASTVDRTPAQADVHGGSVNGDVVDSLAKRLCAAAISYADLGFLVLPLWSAHDGRCDCGKAECTSAGKHPHGRYAPHGLKDATQDGAAICSWFNNGQAVNIGILTGIESGIVVLDVDPRHGGDESLCTLDPLPDTAMATTGGGGWHYFFRHPGDEVRNSVGKLGDGLDIRGDGGYVVAAPSIHISGQCYRWMRDPRAGIADLPACILDRLSGPKQASQAARAVTGIIPAGRRDDTLASMAGSMRRRGMTQEAILAALRVENERCVPPKDEADLVRISRSVARYQPVQQVSESASAPFPVAALPSPVDRFVTEGAAAMGCAPSFIALPLLVGLASAIGATRRIQLKCGWSEPSVLWGAIVAPSGTLKSPAMELALRPIRERQHDRMKRYHLELERYQIDLADYEKEYARWKRTTNGNDAPMKPQEPTAEELWTGDATTEAVAGMLSNNPRGILLAADELNTWIGGFDRYSQGKGGDAAHWLQMHGARSLKINRKTGVPRILYIPRAAVCVVGGIQPDILRRALGREHRQNGLAARLLLTCPPRRIKEWTEADINPEREREMHEIFKRLYNLDFAVNSEGDRQPIMMPLLPEAKSEWIEFYREFAAEQAALSGDLAAAYSKLEGYAARLALVIHLTRWAAADPTLKTVDAIDAKSVQAGVALVRWFADEARRMYARLSETTERGEQRRLIETIKAKGGSITARQLQRSSRRYPTAELAEAALNSLADAGVGCWERQLVSKNGGRQARVFTIAERADVDTTSVLDAENEGSVSVNGEPQNAYD